MPYFVKIGSVPENDSRVGSRGWYIRRQEKSVVVHWGAVEVRRGGSKTSFAWSPGWPRTTTYDEDSHQEASALVVRKAKEKTSRGYQRLPAGASIRRSARP